MVSVCAHVFIKRLSELRELSATDECALLNIIVPGRTFAKGLDIIADGSAPTSVSIVVSGAACRYKVLSGGQRQVLGFLFPGDMANDLGAGVVLDHAISASTTPCVIEKIPGHEFQQVLNAHPNIARAVWQYSRSEGALYRSWLVNTRRRSAPERLAYLFCEQSVRLQAVGLAELRAPRLMHIVQSDLADATGMSVVHLNRTLQQLRSRELIGREPGKLEILDWDGLTELAEFDPTYLRSLRAKLPASPAQTPGKERSEGRVLAPSS
jgi:CRP-like cAMP-binding protein